MGVQYSIYKPISKQWTVLTPTIYTLLAEGRGDSNHRKKSFKRSSRSSLGNLYENDTPKTWIPSSIRNYTAEGIKVLLEDAPGTDVSGLLCLNITFFFRKQHFSEMQYSGFPNLVECKSLTSPIACFFSYSKNSRVAFCRGWCHTKAKEAGVSQGVPEVRWVMPRSLHCAPSPWLLITKTTKRQSNVFTDMC